jgi:hypothetical protein
MASKAASRRLTPRDLNAQRLDALGKLYRKSTMHRSKLPAQGVDSLVRDGLAAEQPSPHGEGTTCWLTKAGALQAHRLFASRRVSTRPDYCSHCGAYCAHDTGLYCAECSVVL